MIKTTSVDFLNMLDLYLYLKKKVLMSARTSNQFVVLSRVLVRARALVKRRITDLVPFFNTTSIE